MKGLIDSSLLMLCENIQSQVELNTDTSRGGSLDMDKNQPVEPQNGGKPQLLMSLYFFIEDLIGRALRSMVKVRRLAQGLLSGTDACQHKGLSPDHPAEGTVSALTEPPHCSSICYSRYSP